MMTRFSSARKRGKKREHRTFMNRDLISDRLMDLTRNKNSHPKTAKRYSIQRQGRINRILYPHFTTPPYGSVVVTKIRTVSLF